MKRLAVFTSFATLAFASAAFALPLGLRLTLQAASVAAPTDKDDEPTPGDCTAWIADGAAEGLADGANVEKWTANDGATISSVGYHPTVALDAFNGHSALFFDMQASPSIDGDILTGATELSICFVVKAASYSSSNILLRHQLYDYAYGGFTFKLYLSSEGNFASSIKNNSSAYTLDSGISCGATKSSSYGFASTDDSAPVFVVIATISASRNLFTLSVNGVTKSTAVSLSDGFGSFTLEVGNSGGTSGGKAFNGWISEIRLYPAVALSSEERNAVGASLAAKYGATWSAE